MRGVQIFEFDSKGLAVSVTRAPQAAFDGGNAWVLKNATRTEFNVRPGSAAPGAPARPTAGVSRSTVPSFRWPTEISHEMVAVALLKPERMATYDLFTYIRHLDANGQTAQRYEIEFWKKVFYPLSCVVMVILALPFAYLHFRSGGIAAYVFAGVMIGISFFLLNNVFGYVGNLQNWQPWLAAATPGLLYMAISLAAFGWLVLRR
jgi:lipopolysaccharide export system permease protein